MTKRQTTSEERALFHAAASGDVSAIVPKRPAMPPRRARKTEGGLDGNTRRRLERGEITPDAKLDLHGMTEAAAHRTLATFIHTAHRRGCRLVLVVTGKGAPNTEAAFDLGLGGRPRGVLNATVPRWLEEPPLAQVIAYKGQAHRRHGGAGALYIYLQKI